MSYSLDFRRKVFETKAKKGSTFEETSQHFGISVRTLFRWQNKIEPCTTRKPATRIDMGALLEDVRQYPDAYHHERVVNPGPGAQDQDSVSVDRSSEACSEHDRPRIPAKKR